MICASVYRRLVRVHRRHEPVADLIPDLLREVRHEVFELVLFIAPTRPAHRAAQRDRGGVPHRRFAEGIGRPRAGYSSFLRWRRRRPNTAAAAASTLSDPGSGTT